MKYKVKNKITLSKFYLLALVCVCIVVSGVFLFVDKIFAVQIGIDNIIDSDGAANVRLPAIEATDHEIYGFSFKYANPAVSSIMMVRNGLSATSLTYCLENGLDEDVTTDLDHYCHPEDFYPVATENGFVATYRGPENSFTISSVGTLVTDIYFNGNFDNLPTNIDVDIEYVDSEYVLYDAEVQLHKYVDPQDPPQKINQLIYEHVDTAVDTVTLRWPEIPTATSYRIYYADNEAEALEVQNNDTVSVSHWAMTEITDYQSDPNHTGYLDYDFQVADIESQYIVMKAVANDIEATEASNIGFMYGDVNRSGSVSSGDATLILNYVLNNPDVVFNEIKIQSADVNMSGDLSAGDATITLNSIFNTQINLPYNP